MKKSLLLLLFSVLSLVTFSGCESNEASLKELIIGKWRFETVETNGEFASPTELMYWEFLSNGVFIITEGKYTKSVNWDIVDSKLIVNNSYSSYYTIIKLTKSNLDIKYENPDFTSIYHLVKAF